jgi:hypothetical protein
MTDLKKAAQQALEALENTGDLWWNSKDEAITALKAALEQPAQAEPEWLTGCPSCGMDGGCDCDDGTYNPPRREWRGLTEEEIKDYKLCGLVRDVEAKLKERNA